MSHTITHFMWGYQAHFRSGLEVSTRRVIEDLNIDLNPEVCLVGVRIVDDGRLHPACVEPEHHHWAESSTLYDVLEDVPALIDSYPESKLTQSHPIAQANDQQRLYRRAIRDAILNRLNANSQCPAAIRLYASYPVERDGFLVTAILSVNNESLRMVPSLPAENIKVHEYRSFSVPESFVEAVIERILANAAEALFQPDAGAAFGILGDSDEIFRRAGVVFFRGLLHRVDEESLYLGADEDVFRAISRLAVTPYESIESSGKLLFASKEQQANSPVLTFDPPITLAEPKTLRKLLTLTNEHLILRCNLSHAFELVREQAIDFLEGLHVLVTITGRAKWSVRMKGRELMRVADGIPALPEPVVDEELFARELRRRVPDMSITGSETFAQLGTVLAESGHGALLIVASTAEAEASRLGSESLTLVPRVLNPELAATLSQIDGAMLCSPDGVCHAAGVILDGMAVEAGERGRGSRFNSANRYVQSQQQCAGMVVSEDGGLTLLPKLKPSLSRAALDQHLVELQQLAHTPADPPDRRRASRVISWLEEHRFYLTELECVRSNEHIALCDDHFSRVIPDGVHVTRTMLSPNPDFDPDRDLV